MVYPVPHEAALQQWVAVYGVPVVLQAAHRVAHGVAVFDHDVGALVAGVAGILREVFDRGVHDAHDVGVPVELGALVDNGARVVLALEEAVGLLEAVAVAALVAQAPSDDRGVVAVALVHVVYAVQYGIEPLGLLGQRVLAVALGVALDVGFVPEVDAGRVAEVVPQLVVGVVAGAHGVDAKLLHEGYVAAHLGGGDVVAAVHGVLVAVHAAYLHGTPVEAQLAATDVYVAEADALGDALGGVARGVAQGDGEGVEVGGAVAPGGHAVEGEAGRGKPVAGLQTLLHRPAAAVDAPLHTAPLHLAAQVDHQVEAAGRPVDGVEVGHHLEVGDVGLRYAVDLDAACDAAHAPHVLALQVAAVAPTYHLGGNTVAAGMQVAGDVPLGWRLRVLAVAHLVTVDVEIHGRLDGAELHYGAAPLPRGRQGEGAGVDAGGVVGSGGVGRVRRELVAHVHIDRHAEALQLDVAGHAYGVPSGGREGGLAGSVEVGELPGAVEAQAPLLAVGHYAVVGLQLVQTVHLEVVPVGLAAHGQCAQAQYEK